MTEKELRRLSRGDLLEMLLNLTRENDRLREDLAQTREQLQSRMIAVENAGSLAEAALQLNDVFGVAQAACEQYSQNLQYRTEHQQEICDEMVRDAEEKCARMLEDAKREADAYWEFVREKVRELYLNQHQTNDWPLGQYYEKE
ncbi:MAG: hypothetical protein J6C98_07440 [Oscillospiraceae bacterium]|nr:hypothetical protein [Oscillospiraceae bacterium]